MLGVICGIGGGLGLEDRCQEARLSHHGANWRELGPVAFFCPPGHSPAISNWQTSLYAATMAGSAHSAAWAGWWNRDVANSTARAAATGSTVRNVPSFTPERISPPQADRIQDFIVGLSGFQFSFDSLPMSSQPGDETTALRSAEIPVLADPEEWVDRHGTVLYRYAILRSALA